MLLYVIPPSLRRRYALAKVSPHVLPGRRYGQPRCGMWNMTHPSSVTSLRRYPASEATTSDTRSISHPSPRQAPRFLRLAIFCYSCLRGIWQAQARSKAPRRFPPEAQVWPWAAGLPPPSPSPRGRFPTCTRKRPGATVELSTRADPLRWRRVKLRTLKCFPRAGTGRSKTQLGRGSWHALLLNTQAAAAA